MNGQELADEMLDAVNSGVNAENVRERVAEGHPALQRYLFRQVLVPALEGIADDRRRDGRNDGVAGEAQAMLDALDE